MKIYIIEQLSNLTSDSQIPLAFQGQGEALCKYEDLVNDLKKEHNLQPQSEDENEWNETISAGIDREFWISGEYIPGETDILIRLSVVEVKE